MIGFSSIWFIFILNMKCSFGVDWKNDEQCGISFTERIIGGNMASAGKYPWLARLGYKTKIKGRYTFLCGGALINKKFVITAAHCLEKDIEIVRLGETAITCASSKCDDPKVQQVPVRKSHKHSEFSKITGFADIALLELRHPVKFSDWVRPLCLIDNELVKLYEKVIAAGFGMENYITRERPDGLKELVLEIIPGSECKLRFPKSDFSSKNYICAGGKKGEDTCNGDSGGPLMQVHNFDRGPRMYLVGIISFGSVKCGVGVPGIFTSIHFHWDWIMRIVLK